MIEGYTSTADGNAESEMLEQKRENLLALRPNGVIGDNLSNRSTSSSHFICLHLEVNALDLSEGLHGTPSPTRGQIHSP